MQRVLLLSALVMSCMARKKSVWGGMDLRGERKKREGKEGGVWVGVRKVRKLVGHMAPAINKQHHQNPTNNTILPRQIAAVDNIHYHRDGILPPWGGATRGIAVHLEADQGVF